MAQATAPILDSTESTVKNAELVEVIGLSGLSNDLFSQDCAPTAVDSLRFPLPLRLRI
jgi:hypothetical protein